MFTPKVLIIGATNVGKSQLFNRLVKDRHSIVLNRKTLTRDLIMRKIKLKTLQEIILIDSGGYSDSLESQFQAEINKLLIDQLRQTNLILFVFSKIDGIRAIERKIAKLVHKYSDCPVLLVANKIDSKKGEENWKWVSQSLGFGEPIPISAEHDINIFELLERIEKCFYKSASEKAEIELNEYQPLKIGVVGKVNVGKSSLVNALLSSDLIIVSPVAGTTVDLVEYSLNYKNDMYLLIDSPGWKKMKKEGVRNEKLEHFSFVKSKKAIKAADILLFVLDLSQSLDYLDERVAKEIFESNLPVIIVVNKSDLLDYSQSNRKDRYEKMIRKEFYYLSWAPIIFVSSKYSKKLENIFKSLDLIRKESSRLFSKIELSSFLGRASLFLSESPKSIVLKDMIQVKSAIPTFVVNCSNPDNLNTQQLRLIESQFRKNFNLVYSPIKIYYKKH